MRKDFRLCLNGNFFCDAKIDPPVAPASTVKVTLTGNPKKALELYEHGWSLRKEEDSEHVPIYIIPGSLEAANDCGRNVFRVEVHSGPMYDLFA